MVCLKKKKILYFILAAILICGCKQEAPLTFQAGTYEVTAQGNNGDIRLDWDLLLLLDKPQKESSDFDKYAYPIMEQSFDLWQYFSVHTYTKDEWYNTPHSMFYFNVEQDKQLIYES